MRQQWKGREWYVNEYLKSQHWIEFMKVVRSFWGNSCALCNKSGLCDGHHRTYYRLGEEVLQDVILLCRDCHNKHHNKTIDSGGVVEVKPEPFTEPKEGFAEVDVTELVKAAMNDPGGATEKGLVAAIQLEELAWQNGWSKEETRDAADWAQVGEMALKEK